MDRIRLGLTGLGAILAIVFIASAGMRSSDGPAPKSAAGETLSVLGVAPKMDEGAESARKKPAPAAVPASDVHKRKAAQPD